MAKKERIKAASPDTSWEEEMAGGIRIDPHALDECLIQQPDLFYRVSQKLALTISQRDAAKDELKVIESEVDEVIRADAEQEEKKMSETAIKAAVIVHADVKAQQRHLNDLNAQVGQLGALKEAYMQRSYALKELVSLYLANYYGDGSGGSNTKGGQAVKDAKYDDNRKALHAERRSRREE